MANARTRARRSNARNDAMASRSGETNSSRSDPSTASRSIARCSSGGVVLFSAAAATPIDTSAST